MITPSTDPELWSEDLAFFLCDSASAIGERGANLQPTGAASHHYDKHTDSQLRAVRRAYRIRAQWAQQARAHRATHLAYYVGFYRAPRQVVSRFGVFSGVVVAQFTARFWTKQSTTYEKPIDAARDALEQVTFELSPHEAELRELERRLEHDRRSGYILQRSERQELREAHREATEQAKPLWSKRDGVLAKLAELEKATRSGDPVDDLVRLCQRGEQSSLRDAAEADVRAAHRGWMGRIEETFESILEAV